MGSWARQWALWAFYGCMLHQAACQLLSGSAAPFTVTVQNPQVTVGQAAQSSWTLEVAPSDLPVAPNPLPLGQTGNVAYQVTVRKDGDGSSRPTGVFTITGTVYMQTFSQQSTITTVDVVLAGGPTTINQRYPVGECTPTDRILRMGSFVQCTLSIPAVSLQGQVSGTTISFAGYTLQPFVTYNIPAGVINSGSWPVTGQVVGSTVALTFPTTTGSACAILSQVFEGTTLVPTTATSSAGTPQPGLANPTTFNPVQICVTSSLSWANTFVFAATDCQGSTAASVPRQIRSTFRLAPEVAAGTPAPAPQTQSTSVTANLVCSATTSTPAPVPRPVPVPAPAPTPVPVVAPVPAPIVAPVPAPIVAPVPAPIVAPVPAPVVAPVPAPVVAPVPAPSVTLVPAPGSTSLPFTDPATQAQAAAAAAAQQAAARDAAVQRRQADAAARASQSQFTIVPRPYYTAGQTWSNPMIPTRPATIAAAAAAAAFPASTAVVRAPTQLSRPLVLPRGTQPLRLAWQGVTHVRATGYSWLVNQAVFAPNPVNLAVTGATRVKVTTSYARAGPFAAGSWSGSVILTNPNPGPLYVNDVWVNVQYKDGRRTTAVRSTCPRGAKGQLEVPGGGRPSACRFAFTAPVRANTQVVRLQARTEVVGGQAVTLTTELAQLRQTPGYRQQEAARSHGSCAVVLEGMKGDLQSTLVSGNGPFNRPLRVCSNTAFTYQLQLLAPLLGACQPLRAQLMQSATPQGSGQARVTRVALLTANPCPRRG